MENKRNNSWLRVKFCFLLISIWTYSAFYVKIHAVESNHKTVKITISNSVKLPRQDDGSARAQGDREVLKAFKKHYPWIEVVQSGGIAVEGQWNVGPLMAIAGGISPDIIYTNFRKSDSYIQQGFLYPLDEFIEQMPKEELAERIPTSVKPVVYREGPNGKKRWWGFPYGTSFIVLQYRKDLFREAGLDPDRPPENWEEMLAYSRKITNPDKGICGVYLQPATGASQFFYSFLLSAGARAVEQNKKGEWLAAFNTPEAVEAVYFYARIAQQKFVKNGKTIPGTAELTYTGVVKWEQGKLAMHQVYFDDLSMTDLNINPELVGIAPMPKGPTGLMISVLNAPIMGIFAGVTDPEVRDAAWKFIYFWGSDEANRIRTRVLIENGFAYVLNPVKIRKYGYTEYLKYIPKGWEKTYTDSVLNGIPEPYGKNCDLIYSYLSRPLDIAIVEDLGNKPPEVAKKRIKEILDAAVSEVNEKMVGKIPPKKMALRRKVAIFLAAVIVLTFFLAFRYIMKVFTPEGAKTGWGFKKNWIAYLILVPAVFNMALWQYVPTIRGAIIAFMDYRIMGGSTFVGIDNFANVLFDKVFWDALWHSLYFATLILGLGFIAPIILAVFLHEIPKGKVFFRIVFYLPHVISGLVIIFLWRSFYDPSASGLLNKFLLMISSGKILPQKWLGNPNFAMLCVVIPIVWASMGPGCLIYLAALKTIPDDLYEAASIDGSNTWYKFWNVTIPTIKPLIIINFVGAFVGAFKSADFILAMTGGGPAGATQVLGLEIFFNAFLYLKFGVATAMGWLLGFILLGFTVYQLKRLTKMQFRTTE
ncbi:MAG: extracellular solute-binding protein [Elusimicrobia bacterium]|nr:extracellular solute-binding protein [Elusimicrobiota bacterium]